MHIRRAKRFLVLISAKSASVVLSPTVKLLRNLASRNFLKLCVKIWVVLGGDQSIDLEFNCFVKERAW